MSLPIDDSLIDWTDQGLADVFADDAFERSSSENDAMSATLRLVADPLNQSFGVLFTDLDRKIKFSNHGAAVMLSTTVDNVLGQNLDRVLIDDETQLRLPGDVPYPGSSHIVRVRTPSGGSYCLILYRYFMTGVVVNIFSRNSREIQSLFTDVSRFPIGFLDRAQAAIDHTRVNDPYYAAHYKWQTHSSAAARGGQVAPDMPLTHPMTKKVRNFDFFDPAPKGNMSKTDSADSNAPSLSTHKLSTTSSILSRNEVTEPVSPTTDVADAKIDAVQKILEMVESAMLPMGDSDSQDSESLRKFHMTDPSKRRGRWTYEEDSKLLDLIKVYVEQDTDWGDIASKMEGRTKKQCKSRWEEHLRPDVNKEAFTPEEDRILEYYQSQPETKNKWKAIAAKLSGRTGNTVKARWISIARKRNKKRKGEGDSMDEFSLYSDGEECDSQHN